MAGVVVEDRYQPQDLEDRLEEVREWVLDGEDPEDLGDMAIFAKYPRFADDAYRDAFDLLDDYREAHEVLTAALLASTGRMTGPEVMALPAIQKMFEGGS